VHGARAGGGREAASLGRRHGRVGPAVDEQEGQVLEEPDDPERLGRPRVRAEPASSDREGPPGEPPADRSGPAQPARDGGRQLRGHRLGHDRHEPRPRGGARCDWRVWLGVHAGESSVAQDDGRRQRRDPAHRGPEQGDPADPTIPEPRHGPADVFDLAEPEGRLGRIGSAVPAEVEAQDAGRPAQRRPVL
jgi:hypothetical protein